jgi:hypothetical protein
MKKLLFSISLILIAATSFGQWLGDSYYILNFEDTFALQHLRIDTLINQNNLWQVGSPQKTIFTSAFSVPNVIVTDTTNSYPTNDTSSFIIVNVVTGGGFELPPHTVILAGEYYVNSDTLTDYGTIEFSPDNGTTWVDLINDTTYASLLLWIFQKPTLTGNSNGWQSFKLQLAQLGPVFNIQDGDTVLYRFTFISDSIQTNKDGLMFDNLHFEDWVEGIEEIQNDNLISIFPNPASDELRIHRTKVSANQRIQILNYTGQVLYSNSNFIEEAIDIRQLTNGTYLLKYSDSKNFSIKKFVVQH